MNDDADLPPEEPGAPVPRVLTFRAVPVVLAADVAAAFGVETREVTQAIRRNPQKFNETHAFVLDEAEREVLRSQAVISGRGWAPTVLTQKGVVRLATVLTSPKALEATDHLIDLFLEVYGQLRAGRTEVAVSKPSRLAPSPQETERRRGLRLRLIEAMESLLGFVIDPRRNTTVGDELGDSASGLIGALRARLERPGLDNARLEAETMKVLQETQDIFERRQADLRRSAAETESILIENGMKKIALVRELFSLLEDTEPDALARVLPRFSDAGVFLPEPGEDEPK